MVRKTIISALIGAGVLFSPLAADAVGLGKLTVMSGLGQPFRGEIELLAVDRNEEGSLAARLASQDAFQEAKIERSSALLSLRFNVEQKKSGQWYVKLSSPQPINEPFLDILVEVNWPSGRLLREYTILLDPPGLAVEQQAAVPVEVPAAKFLPAPAGDAKAVAPGEMVHAKGKRAKPAVAKSEAPGEVKGESYGPVKPGETLSKIASAVKPEGVNVEQMLVSLFRANQQAFAGNNMNRLKTGQILRVPEAGEVSALEKGEAAKEVRAHAADWNAYRQKLAGAVETGKPVHEDEARQAAGGKITAAVEDKAATKEPAKDVLKLSKSESVGGKTVKGGTQDEFIARDKAIQEANQRIAELEKNIRDMQKLLEIRSQGMADLQKGKQSAAAPQPSATPIPEEKKTETPVTAPVAEKAPEAAPVPVPAAEEPPKPKKPKVVTLQPKQPEVAPPSFLDELLGNPLTLGGGALALLLGGLFGARALAARRKLAGDDKGRAIRVGTSEPRTMPDESFAAAGGVSDFSAGLTDFTQTGMGSIDTADVDPIAEAEVYMAYGRDVQAEEILREAMAHDPLRHEIQLKLLEIYVARKDLGSFEALARQLYAATGGSPDQDWERAAEMGRTLDADNPLYVAVAAPEAMAEAPAAMESFGETPEAVDASPDLDFNLDAVSAAAGAGVDMPLEGEVGEEQVEELASDLDFNLGQEETPVTEENAEAAPEMPETEENLLDFNLEMPGAEPAPEEPAEEVAAGENLVDFDLGTTAQEEAPIEEAAAPAESEASLDEHLLNFDLELPVESTPEQTEPLAAGEEDIFAAAEIEETTIDAEVPESEPADLAMDFELPMEEEAAPAETEALPAAEIAEIQEIAAAPEIAEVPEEVKPFPDFGEAMLLDLGVVPAQEEAAAPAEQAIEELELPAVAAEEEEHESILIAPPAMSDEAMLDFDFSIGEETPETETAAAQQPAPNIDLSDISLDLGAPAEEVEAKPVAEEGNSFQEAATKLDLAKAYIEMGDQEGAREILQEVIVEGSDEQQDDAKKLLAELA